MWLRSCNAHMVKTTGLHALASTVVFLTICWATKSSSSISAFSADNEVFNFQVSKLECCCLEMDHHVVVSRQVGLSHMQHPGSHVHMHAHKYEALMNLLQDWKCATSCSIFARPSVCRPAFSLIYDPVMSFRERQTNLP